VLYCRVAPCDGSSPASVALKIMSTLPHPTNTSVHISSICCAQDAEGSRDATAEHTHAKPEHPPCQGSRCTNARVHALVFTRMRRVGVGGCLRILKVRTCKDAAGRAPEGEQHHVGNKITHAFSCSQLLRMFIIEFFLTYQKARSIMLVGYLSFMQNSANKHTIEMTWCTPHD
jgi:hypothetical protein